MTTSASDSDPSRERNPVRVLHLEDSSVDHDLVRRALQRAGLACELTRVETLDDFARAVEAGGFDAIVADYHLRGFTALDAWAAVRHLASRPPFVLLSGAIGEAAAVEAIQLGMSDYLRKDDVLKLAHVLQRAIEVQHARIAKERADAELATSERRLAEFADHLQSTIEQERASIAREIHDDIGGALAAVKLDLAWIGRHVSDAGVAQHLASAAEMLQHAIGASQRIMMNLRPAILDQGLAAAVEWLAAGFERRTGIRTTLNLHDSGRPIAKAIELAAYRTAQEALTNIAKHAGCSAVSIDLADSGGVLTLEVADDGRGFSDADRAKAKAFGLKGLHERAKSVGGWLDISTSPGRGCAIILSVPFDALPPSAAEEKEAPE